MGNNRIGMELSTQENVMRYRDDKAGPLEMAAVWGGLIIGCLWFWWMVINSVRGA